MPPSPPPQAPRVPHLQPVESEPPGLQAVEPAPEPPPEPPAGSVPPQRPAAQPRVPGGGTPSDGARLLAAQMAVAGSSREEIETRLREEFGIHDAAPILDGILGPG